MLAPLSSANIPTAAKSTDTAILELPFFDDFADYEGLPDAKRWLNSQAFVNKDFAPQPPTIGMATLDALDANGNLLGEVAPVGSVPVVCEGRNSVGFKCERHALRPHARVTVMTLSDKMFGDLPDAAAPSWGRGCIAAPEYGTRSFAAADSDDKSCDFLAP